MLLRPPKLLVEKVHSRDEIRRRKVGLSPYDTLSGRICIATAAATNMYVNVQGN